jgi:DNA topoisomerase VI subunit A
MNWFGHEEHKLLVTAKGYPDFATRRFLTLLAERQSIRMLYIGDADPFGADIYF